MKKLTAILICVTMIITSLTVMSFSAEAKVITDEIGSISYKFDNGTLTISGKGTVTKKLYDSIDDNFITYKVKKIIVKEGITELDGKATGYCFNVKSIQLPASLKKIKNIITFYAIKPDLKTIKVASGNKNYTAVSSVLFNKNKTTLYVYPQSKTGKSYTIPKTVKTIYQGAFADTKVKTITMGSNVKKLGIEAFVRAKANKIVLSSNLTSIPDYTFNECKNLKTISFSNKLKVIGEEAFGQTAICKRTHILKLPPFIKEIKKKAFWDCDGMKGVVVPESIKKIGTRALGYTTTDGENIKKIKNFTIYGKKGSVAYKYAKKNGFKFKVQ